MPLHIDRFFGSPSVQVMQPAAQMGYLRLLCSQWQSDDSTISADPLDLAERSGLGDEVWALYGPRILRNFTIVCDGRYRNRVCFEEWQLAKAVFEKNHVPDDEMRRKRSEAGKKGNFARWGDRKCDEVVSQTDHKASPTTVVTVPVSVPVLVSVPVVPPEKQEPPAMREEESRPVNPPSDGGGLTVANWLREELGIVADGSTIRVIAESVRMLAAEGGSSQTAGEYIREAGLEAKSRGEVINRFWFSDQKYRPQAVRKRETDRQRREREFMEAPTEDGS
jgi:hypothetical protein